MEIKTKSIYEALKKGAMNTVEHKEDLNRINVYPVADKDTGSNLSYMMSGILREFQYEESVKRLFHAFSTLSISYARGNSGNIFSQYFNGLYHGALQLADGQSIEYDDLSICFETGYQKAYASVEAPVEGTILTLMRKWTEEHQALARTYTDFTKRIMAGLEALRVTLTETAQAMKKLKKVEVVDAGALGFYYFIEGFVKALVGDTVEQSSNSPIAPNVYPVRADGYKDIAFEGKILLPEVIINVEHDDASEERYCTEALILKNQDCQVLHDILKRYGSSLIIADADEYLRIHIHTNTPDLVMWKLLEYGTILEQKVDDMQHQKFLDQKLTAGICLITDSIADLPPEMVEQNHIVQLPVNIEYEGNQFLDKVTMSGSHVGKLMQESNSITTSVMSLPQAIRRIEPLLEHYENFLVITVSSKMSGTYQMLSNAFTELKVPQNKYFILDSKTNSGAEGLLVYEAARMIEEGNDFSVMIGKLKQLQQKAKIMVGVLNLNGMLRSGRISNRMHGILNKIGLLPIVTVNDKGEGVLKGAALSQKANLKKLAAITAGHNIKEYAVVYVGERRSGEEFAALLERKLGTPALYISPVSAVIALAAGNGSVAVAYMEE